MSVYYNDLVFIADDGFYYHSTTVLDMVIKNEDDNNHIRDMIALTGGLSLILFDNYTLPEECFEEITEAWDI